MNVTPSLTQAFDGAGVPLSQRDSVTAFAAAKRVAYSLPMPIEPVGSPIDYYNATYAAQANAAIGGMNEAAVMDYDFALKIAQLYWLARYQVLHAPDSSEAMTAVTGLVQSLLAKEHVADLGMVQDPHNSGGGTGSAVAVVDGSTTLVSLNALNGACESLQPAFDALWTSGMGEG